MASCCVGPCWFPMILLSPLRPSIVSLPLLLPVCCKTARPPPVSSFLNFKCSLSSWSPSPAPLPSPAPSPSLSLRPSEGLRTFLLHCFDFCFCKILIMRIMLIIFLLWHNGRTGSGTSAAEGFCSYLCNKELFISFIFLFYIVLLLTS